MTVHCQWEDISHRLHTLNMLLMVRGGYQGGGAVRDIRSGGDDTLDGDGMRVLARKRGWDGGVI